MVKECTISTGKLPLGDLPRNSQIRITDRPDMTSSVYLVREAINRVYYTPKGYIVPAEFGVHFLLA